MPSSSLPGHETDRAAILPDVMAGLDLRLSGSGRQASLSPLSWSAQADHPRVCWPRAVRPNHRTSCSVASGPGHESPTSTSPSPSADLIRRSGGASRSCRRSARRNADKMGECLIRGWQTRDRGREGYWPPRPPNRTCGSPASGSPVGGLTHEGTDGPWHGPAAS
jgi:hypothetical protein